MPVRWKGTGRGVRTVAIVLAPPPGGRVIPGLVGHRLEPVVAALRGEGLGVVVAPWTEERADEVHRELRGVAGVLVWVDPVSDGRDRRVLDEILVDVAAEGAWVSARPDVVAAIGTKDVLVRSAPLGWSGDAHLVRDLGQLWSGVAPRLERDRVRVLKSRRGNGGAGVWKIRLAENTRGPLRPESAVVLQHAAVRDVAAETMSLANAFARVATSFRAPRAPGLVDQAYVPEVAAGLLRSYLVGGRVVGFGRQGPPACGSEGGEVFGLPSAKAMLDADTPALVRLRRRLEEDWVPGLCRLVGLEPHDLPALWDVDLFGADPDYGGSDERAVLCEINASCVTPFPPEAPAALAAATARAIR